ncbi:MAG: DUF3572 domain-containing protein [Roseobacter sp.]
MPYTQDSAETLGLKVLGWLAANEELLPVFQNASGVSEADIRANAGDAQFLGAVLDFVMMDDAWVVGCCEALSVPNTSIFEARQALPGGEQVNWT